MTDGKVVRRTLPTMSFTAPKPLLDWLEDEAKRRSMKRSHLLTELLEKAKADTDEQAQQKGRQAA